MPAVAPSTLGIKVLPAPAEPWKALVYARPVHREIVRVFQRRSAMIGELIDNDEDMVLPSMLGFMADLPRVLSLQRRLDHVASASMRDADGEVGMLDIEIDRTASGPAARKNLMKTLG